MFDPITAGIGLQMGATNAAGRSPGLLGMGSRHYNRLGYNTAF